jgi:hypothetical protein
MILPFAVLLATIVAPATPGPVPSPSATPLRTIATVKSTPYCTAFAAHFNGAVQPMLVNDRTLDSVSVSLDDIDSIFHKPDFAIRFGAERAKLTKYVDDLQKNLPFMQTQINQLRAGEALTKDAGARQEMHQLAQELQRAYDKQKQLATDLLGVVQAMMQTDTSNVDPTDARGELADMQLPADMKSTKSYLRFDGQRDVIGDAEDKAGDLAIDEAEKYCTK